MKGWSDCASECLRSHVSGVRYSAPRARVFLGKLSESAARIPLAWDGLSGVV